MSFMKASTKKEDIQAGGNSAYINKSGCYPVNLIAPFLSVSASDSTVVDLYVEHADQAQTIYGNMRITNKNGATNAIGQKLFNQLMIVAGVEEVSDPVDADLPIGKEGAEKTVAVLEDLADVDVMMRIQLEYTVYNNNIQESKAIRGFYRAGDNASAEEIVNETEAGKQFDDDSKHFNNVTYKDGLNEEAVSAWIAAKRPKGTGGGSGSSSAPTKKPGFGKNKKFGK